MLIFAGCLKEFLSIAPHDRKFFLPETAQVLKKSISEMDNFTAYKAMNGFESISQYANNLFTKPWRKEYRVIKVTHICSYINQYLMILFRCIPAFTIMKSNQIF